MKTKQEIVENWLPRYTQRPVKDFTKYILLTNFSKYVEIFATHFHVPILGEDSNMPSASADGVTIINFGMGTGNNPESPAFYCCKFPLIFSWPIMRTTIMS